MNTNWQSRFINGRCLVSHLWFYHARVVASVIAMVASTGAGCDCDAGINPTSDDGSVSHDGLAEAGSFEGGEAGEAGEGGMLDGGSVLCGTTPCCDPGQLPMLDDVGLITARARDVAFEPDMPRGTTRLAVTWVGSTVTADITDMEFLSDVGPLHIRLPVLAVPALDVGQALELEIVRPPLHNLVIEGQDDRIALHDGTTGDLLAIYVSQTASGIAALSDLDLARDGLSMSSEVTCQGPVGSGCNYQTELLDLWFSAGGEPTILAQGEMGTLVKAPHVFRLMNRQAFDNGGEALGKVSCGIPAGVRSFDIVLRP